MQPIPTVQTPNTKQLLRNKLYCELNKQHIKAWRQEQAVSAQNSKTKKPRSA
jgi:hypothetical protein